MKEQKKSFVQKFADGFRLAEDLVSVLGMVAFGAAIMVEIVRRALGGSGISWLQEFSQLMFVLSVFIGCSRAVETDEHMFMDVIYRVVPEKYTWPLRSLVDLIMVGISGWLCYITIRYTIYTYKLGTSTQTISSFKMWIIWVPLAFCMVTMTLRYVIVFVRRLRNGIRGIYQHTSDDSIKEV